ncbi:MAG: hypothetical protein ABIH42_00655, partial [Planctomycetota bacterium]
LIPPWEYDTVRELEKKNIFIDYINKYFKENKELFKKLAWNDYRDTGRYPNFDEWYKSLDTKLDKNYVRILLRKEIVRKIADEEGKEPVCNLPDDEILQRGIAEALGKLGKKPEDYEEYKNIINVEKGEKIETK